MIQGHRIAKKKPENKSRHICVWSRVYGVLICDRQGYFYTMLVHSVHLEAVGGIAGFLHRLYKKHQLYFVKSRRLVIKRKAAKRENYFLLRQYCQIHPPHAMFARIQVKRGLPFDIRNVPIGAGYHLV